VNAEVPPSKGNEVRRDGRPEVVGLARRRLLQAQTRAGVTFGHLLVMRLELPHRVEVAVLDNVRGVDAPLEPGVQAHRQHRPQPTAVPLEQLDDGAPVARGDAHDATGNPSRWRRHFILAIDTHCQP
jgi:hypothetical protein